MAVLEFNFAIFFFRIPQGRCVKPSHIAILTVSANLRQKQHIFTSDQHNKFNHKLKKLNSKFMVIVMMPITMIDRCLDDNDHNDGLQ